MKPTLPQTPKLLSKRSPEPLLAVDRLQKFFPIRGGLWRRVVANVRAVDDVTFYLQRGKTLGLVGESGCGKSTLGRTVMRLLDPSAGSIYFDGEDLSQLSASELRQRRPKMQMIFQDPYASLSPRRTVQQILREPLDTYQRGTPEERNFKIIQLLKTVGLRANVLHRYPHEFSGGQRQRIGIARALALEPKLIVADEPVSALDVSVQAQVLNLIAKLQQEHGIAFLFISHDLAVVQHVSDDIAVMYLGQLMEWTAADRLYQAPKHPYTQALLSAVPQPQAENKVERQKLPGEVPSPLNPPTGCPFHTRCPQALSKCSKVVPMWQDTGSPDQPHFVRCHLYEN